MIMWKREPKSLPTILLNSREWFLIDSRATPLEHCTHSLHTCSVMIVWELSCGEVSWTIRKGRLVSREHNKTSNFRCKVFKQRTWNVCMPQHVQKQQAAYKIGTLYKVISFIVIYTSTSRRKLICSSPLSQTKPSKVISHRLDTRPGSQEKLNYATD